MKISLLFSWKNFKKHKRVINLLWWRCSSPNTWCNFSWKNPLIALIMANAALYWNDSVLPKKWFIGGLITSDTVIVKMRSNKKFCIWLIRTNVVIWIIIYKDDQYLSWPYSFCQLYLCLMTIYYLDSIQGVSELRQV